jgi:hypothetical protein
VLAVSAEPNPNPPVASESTLPSPIENDKLPRRALRRFSLAAKLTSPLASAADGGATAMRPIATKSSTSIVS